MKQKTLFRPQYWKIWTIISDHPKIEPFDEKVYAAIDWFHGMKDGECRASNATIAILIKPTDPQSRSVQNSLNRLESCGFIRREYKDTAKRNRIRITPLISPILERTTGDRQETSETVMIDERNGDDRASETAMTRVRVVRKNISKNTDTAPSAEITKIFEIFQTINPTINYGNTTQRKAVVEMIKKIGFEKTNGAARYAVSVLEKQYAPVITTPYQLKEKLSALIAYHEKDKGQKINIINLDNL